MVELQQIYDIEIIVQNFENTLCVQKIYTIHKIIIKKIFLFPNFTSIRKMGPNWPIAWYRDTKWRKYVQILYNIKLFEKYD